MSDKSLNEILASCDAEELLKSITNFELKMRLHVDEEILYSASGEPNYRNRYGAMLHHCAMLTSVLRNFGVGDPS